jgi:hypothetical protein
MRLQQAFPHRIDIQKEPIHYEDETIVITDPCYLSTGDEEREDRDDFAPSNVRNFQALRPYINASTLYGDWSCHTMFNTDEFKQVDAALEEYSGDWQYPLIYYSNKARMKELREQGRKFVLGRFCADSGMVIVCAMSDVLAFNPKAKEEFFIPRYDHCATVIENFSGTVTYNVTEDNECYLEGTGNIPFITRQTGL